VLYGQKKSSNWLEGLTHLRCACDVPAHAYNFSWEGNPNWSMAYVTSEEIFDYYKGRAKAYGMYDYLHTKHRVVRADWQEEDGFWKLEVEDLVNSLTFTDQAEVVINSTGFLKFVNSHERSLDNS
jgi:cation diffusion facilitator CzcD-associated flavoprotein CzcO